MLLNFLVTHARLFFILGAKIDPNVHTSLLMFIKEFINNGGGEIKVQTVTSTVYAN